jgi:hypothetical protein
MAKKLFDQAIIFLPPCSPERLTVFDRKAVLQRTKPEAKNLIYFFSHRHK